jgi:hypothetical protein
VNHGKDKEFKNGTESHAVWELENVGEAEAIRVFPKVKEARNSAVLEAGI